MVMSNPERLINMLPLGFSRRDVWKERLIVEAELFSLLDLARFLTDAEIDQVGSLLLKVFFPTFFIN